MKAFLNYISKINYFH